MDNATAKAKINDILSSKEKTSEWAKMKGISEGRAIAILEKLAEQPQLSEESKKYIWEQSSSDTKSYVAGEEMGYKRGHSVGFGKGLAWGVLSCVAMGAAIVVKGVSNGAIDFTKMVSKPKK